MKINKILVIGIVLLISTITISTQAAAHSPRYMKLTYEPDTLKVTVLHFSLAPFRLHYVYRIEIEKNGQQLQTELYQNQPRFIFFSYTFSNITATSGDELTVTASCSLFGQLIKSIIV